MQLLLLPQKLEGLAQVARMGGSPGDSENDMMFRWDSQPLQLSCCCVAVDIHAMAFSYLNEFYLTVTDDQ